jgi:YggT family protein
MVLSLLRVLDFILLAYMVVLFARAALSWFRLPPYHPISRHLLPAMYNITEPLLAPIRRWLAPYQGNSPLDFSVMILMFAVIAARQLLYRLMYTVAGMGSGFG